MVWDDAAWSVTLVTIFENRYYSTRRYIVNRAAVKSVSRYLSLICIQLVFSRVTVFINLWTKLFVIRILADKPNRRSVAKPRRLQQFRVCRAEQTTPINCHLQLVLVHLFNKRTAFTENLPLTTRNLWCTFGPPKLQHDSQRPSERNSITDFIECIAVIVHCTNESSSQC